MRDYTFRFGHLTAGEHEYTVKSAALADRVRELVDELYDADDGHYMVYFRIASGESLTIGHTGMMVRSSDGNGQETYCLPTSRDRVYEIATDFVCGNMKWWAGDFSGKRPAAAEDRLPLFARDRKGTIDFPLHQAAEQGELVRVKMLVKAGWDVNQRDTHRCAPISYAAVNGHMAVCQFLVERGADTTVKDGWGNTLLSLSDEYPELQNYFKVCGTRTSKDTDSEGNRSE